MSYARQICQKCELIFFSEFENKLCKFCRKAESEIKFVEAKKNKKRAYVARDRNKITPDIGEREA